MKKFCLFLRSFWRNVIIKRKIRPYIALMTDPQYKSDIRHMYRITKDCQGVVKALIPFASIDQGHKVLYPEYVATLSRDKILPPIKVAKDGHRYRVVDGNHRYAAMKTWVKDCESIWVDLLV